MIKGLTKNELVKIYKILKAVDEGMIINPDERREMDYYDKPILDAKGIKSILKKVESTLPEEGYIESKKEVLRRRYDSFRNKVDDSVYEKLEKAFENNKVIEIDYFDMRSGEPIKRRISIYYINIKYIVAYCHLRKDMRKFRASRVVNAKITDKNYKIPKNFDKRDYL